jgi:hypothetical protein
MTYIDALDIGCAQCGATYTVAEQHACNPLRDGGRVLAHSLADELPPPRPTIERVVGGWREVGEIVAGMVIFGALFIGIPFLLWLAAS